MPKCVCLNNDKYICFKRGKRGHAGPTGPTGPTGASGPTGPAGEGGSGVVAIGRIPVIIDPSTGIIGGQIINPPSTNLMFEDTSNLPPNSVTFTDTGINFYSPGRYLLTISGGQIVNTSEINNAKVSMNTTGDSILTSLVNIIPLNNLVIPTGSGIPFDARFIINTLAFNTVFNITISTDIPVDVLGVMDIVKLI